MFQADEAGDVTISPEAADVPISPEGADVPISPEAADVPISLDNSKVGKKSKKNKKPVNIPTRDVEPGDGKSVTPPKRTRRSAKCQVFFFIIVRNHVEHFRSLNANITRIDKPHFKFCKYLNLK